MFQQLRGNIEKLKPIFELYGEYGIEMYEKLAEIEELTKDTMQIVDEDGNIAYSGYFYMKSNCDEELARKYVLEYIKAINTIYVEEFEEEALYHISNDYYLSHYISWSVKDMPNMNNPFLPYYKLWCMGLEVSFVEKDKVLIFK